MSNQFEQKVGGIVNALSSSTEEVLQSAEKSRNNENVALVHCGCCQIFFAFDKGMRTISSATESETALQHLAVQNW